MFRFCIGTSVPHRWISPLRYPSSRLPVPSLCTIVTYLPTLSSSKANVNPVYSSLLLSWFRGNERKDGDIRISTGRTVAGTTMLPLYRPYIRIPYYRAWSGVFASIPPSRSRILPPFPVAPGHHGRLLSLPSRSFYRYFSSSSSPSSFSSSSPSSSPFLPPSSSSTGVSNLSAFGIAVLLGLFIYWLNSRILQVPPAEHGQSSSSYAPLTPDLLQLLTDAHNLLYHHNAPLSAAQKYETVYNRIALPSANIDPFHKLEVLLWLSNAQEEGQQWRPAYESLTKGKDIVWEILRTMVENEARNERKGKRNEGNASSSTNNTEVSLILSFIETVQPNVVSSTLSSSSSSSLTSSTLVSHPYPDRDRFQRRSFFRKAAILFSRLSDLEHRLATVRTDTTPSVDDRDDKALYYAYLGCTLLQYHHPLLWERIHTFAAALGTEYDRFGRTHGKHRRSGSALNADDTALQSSYHPFTVNPFVPLSREETEELIEYVTLLMKMITNTQSSSHHDHHHRHRQQEVSTSPFFSFVHSLVDNPTYRERFGYLRDDAYVKKYLRVLKLTLLGHGELLLLDTLNTGSPSSSAALPSSSSSLKTNTKNNGLSIVWLPLPSTKMTVDNYRRKEDKEEKTSYHASYQNGDKNVPGHHHPNPTNSEVNATTSSVGNDTASLTVDPKSRMLYDHPQTNKGDDKETSPTVSPSFHNTETTITTKFTTSSANKDGTVIVVPTVGMESTISSILQYILYQEQQQQTTDTVQPFSQPFSRPFRIPGNEGNIYSSYTANHLIQAYNQLMMGRTAPSATKKGKPNAVTNRDSYASTQNLNDISFLLENLTMVEEMLPLLGPTDNDSNIE